MYNILRKRGIKQMYIAICDDDIQFCDILKNEIYTYSNNHNWESVVDVYYSGEEICNTNKKYDIIILDYTFEQLFLRHRRQIKQHEKDRLLRRWDRALAMKH